MRGGRITTIDGGDANPVTDGYICAKVRRFDRRVYGDDRLHFPAVRVGAKGEGAVPRRQLERRARPHRRARSPPSATTSGGEAILPLCYGGSNGLLTQDAADARLFRRLGAARLARTVCAAPTGAANQALYGKMPSVVYQDYPEARLILLWGVEPVGLGHPPDAVPARRRGSAAPPSSSSIRAPRRWPARPTSTWRSGPAPTSSVALALHRHLFESGAADHGLPRRAHDRRRTAARARRSRGPSSAPPR